MIVCHDSKKLEYRTPFGAVPSGTEITLRLKITLEHNEKPPVCVCIRLWKDAQETLLEMTKVNKDTYETVVLCENPALLWYFFVIDSLFYGADKQLTSNQPPSFQITVYSNDYKTPKWFHKSVIYQIFVDRFYNGNKDKSIFKKRDDYYIHQNWNEPVSEDVRHNDFYGGNLLGIIEKLDYLVDLGVSALYLNPIFEAYSNHKYDTADYLRIDPMFGDEKIFKKLCKESKKRGISIILDGVFNHTGDDSKYFNKYGNYDTIGAYQSPDSPYFQWYNFEEYPNKYESWWGVSSLPQVNEMAESYRDFIINNNDSVIRRWLKNGARGWRLDVVDELPAPFVKEIRTAVKQTNNDAVIIGEVWEDASNKISYGVQREYFLGNELDGAMNYPFKNAINDFLTEKISAEVLAEIVDTIRENYPPQSLASCMNLIGSHDTMRVETLYGNTNSVKLAALWQMTFIGVPVIFYGDEVGLGGGADPYNRAPFPWNNVDLELRDWYKKLISLRNSNPALQTGNFSHVIAEGNVYGYIRWNRKCSILTIINRNTETENLIINLSPWGGKKRKRITLAPQSGFIYNITNDEELI